MRVWIGYEDPADDELTGHGEKWVLTAAEGISAVDMSLGAQGVAGRDGAAVRDPRVEARTISLSFALTGDAREARRELMAKFEPKRKLWLRFADGVPVIREMSIAGYADAVDVTQDSPIERVEVQIYCPDPWFRGEEYRSGPETTSFSWAAPARGQGWRLRMWVQASSSALTVTANGVQWRVPSLQIGTRDRNEVVLDTTVSPPLYTLNGDSYWVNWPVDKDLPELLAENSVVLSSPDWSFEVSYYAREWGFRWRPRVSRS